MSEPWPTLWMDVATDLKPIGLHFQLVMIVSGPGTQVHLGLKGHYPIYSAIAPPQSCQLNEVKQ